MGAKQAGVVLGVVVAVGGGGVLAYQLGRSEPETAGAEPVVEHEAAPEPEAARVRDESWDRDEGRDGWGDWGGRGFDRSAYDLDGDGELSEEERRKMREALRAQWEARMDADGDGVVSDEERRRAMRDRLMSSERGRRFAMRFDADGDGELSEEEWASMREWREERERARLQRVIDRFDLDGDGELSEEEEYVADEARRAQWREAREEFTRAFDADGDGELSFEERGEARSKVRSAMERSRFRDRYDSGGDGTVDDRDLERFLRQYNEGAESADVNRDGSVDSLDVEMFRDLMISYEIEGEDLPDLSQFGWYRRWRDQSDDDDEGSSQGGP